MRQNASLPRTRTGHDEQGHAPMLDRCALLVIQALEKALRVTVLRPTTLAYLSPLSRSLVQRSNRSRGKSRDWEVSDPDPFSVLVVDALGCVNGFGGDIHAKLTKNTFINTAQQN